MQMWCSGNILNVQFSSLLVFSYLFNYGGVRRRGRWVVISDDRRQRQTIAANVILASLAVPVSDCQPWLSDCPLGDGCGYALTPLSECVITTVQTSVGLSGSLFWLVWYELTWPKTNKQTNKNANLVVFKQTHFCKCLDGPLGTGIYVRGRHIVFNV